MEAGRIPVRMGEPGRSLPGGPFRLGADVRTGVRRALRQASRPGTSIRKGHRRGRPMARSPGGILLAAIFLSSCTSQFTPATLTPAPPLVSPTEVRVPASTATPPPKPTPTISAAPEVIVIARGLPGPDDLALAPDGSIWVSDVVAGTVSRLAPDGSLQIIIRGLQAPEGLAFLTDGSLLIAEQGQNRVVRFDPAAAGVTTWLDLPNHTSHPGVDGIAVDAHSASPALIVPDSPNGTVLRVALADRKPQVIASGFTRPVGAWVTQDGSVWVVDETDPGPVVRIRRDGSREEIARLPTPDDIVVDASGDVFVTTLADRAVHWIDSTTGRDHVLVQGLSQPQGLAFDASGNLLVADTGLHQILRIVLRGSAAPG